MCNLIGKATGVHCGPIIPAHSVGVRNAFLEVLKTKKTKQAKYKHAEN